MEDQLELIRQRRMEKFKTMGVAPTFTPDQVQHAQEVSSVHGGNASVRERIHALQTGSMKNEVHSFNEAKGPSDFLPSASEFRVRTNNPKMQASKEEAVRNLGLDKPSKLASPAEARGIEAMFESDFGGGTAYTGDVVMGKAWEDQRKISSAPPTGNLIAEDSIMVSSSWDEQFKNRMSSHQKGQPTQQREVVYENASTSNVNVDMIYQIANDIVDKRMKDLISEVMSTQNKAQKPTGLAYKKVTNKKGELIKDIINIDGKFFRLEEVKLKG